MRWHVLAGRLRCRRKKKDRGPSRSSAAASKPLPLREEPTYAKAKNCSRLADGRPTPHGGGWVVVRLLSPMRGCGRLVQLRRERLLAGVIARAVLVPAGAGGAAGACICFASSAASLVSPGDRADPARAGPARRVGAAGSSSSSARLFDARG